MIEELKKQLTDKYVVVQSGIPELRRFDGLTGTVKTVNWSGRALVQFDGPVDISWYDIDPSYLTIVAEPLPKKAKVEAKPAAAPKPAGAAAPAAKPPGGKSPLELARESAAKNAAGGAAPASTGEKKLSPLELARQQGAAKAGAKPAAALVTAEAAAAPIAAQPEAKPADQPAAKPAGPKPDTASILELARKQGAKKS